MALNFQSLLNKLTSSNLEQLSDMIIEKQVWNDHKNLPAIVDLIFTKAVDEPTFVSIYADLCKTIHRAEINVAGNQRRFYNMVVKKCQTTVEQSLTAPTIDTSAKTEELLEAEKATQKRTMIGIICFIVELYRIKFLNNQVVNHCVVILLYNCNRTGNIDAELNSVNELMIEYSVVLVKSVMPYCSAHLEPEMPLAIDTYIRYLAMFKLIVCNRIRFMIQDLVEGNQG